MSKTVRLMINDQQIRLNPFVQKIFINTLHALVNSLDDIPEEINKVILEIKNEEE